MHSPAPSPLSAIRGSRSIRAGIALLPLAPAADDEALANGTILAMLAEHPHPLRVVA